MPIDRKHEHLRRCSNAYKNYEDAHFVSLGGVSIFLGHLGGEDSCSANSPEDFLELVGMPNRRRNYG